MIWKTRIDRHPNDTGISIGYGHVDQVYNVLMTAATMYEEPLTDRRHWLPKTTDELLDPSLSSLLTSSLLLIF
jgi:hypothetical protein